MYVACYRVRVATPESGGSTVVYTPQFTGRILSVQYIRPSSGGFGINTDLTISSDVTGEIIWQANDVAASRLCRPRVKINAANGSLLEGYDYIVLAEDRLKIAVVQAGAARFGDFHFVIG